MQGLPLISSHCHWLAPSSTTMNTHLQFACWEIQAAIHCYLNFFLFVLGTYGSHSIHWKKFMWFLPPILQIFQQDKSEGNHIKFYIMGLGATLLAETEILPFWRYDLKVFLRPWIEQNLTLVISCRLHHVSPTQKKHMGDFQMWTIGHLSSILNTKSMWWRGIGRKVRGEGGGGGEIRVCLTNLWSRSYCSSTLSSRSRLCSLTHHHISCILLLTGLLREGDSWPVLAQTNLVLRNGFVHPWHMSATTSPCCLTALLTPHCITHLACLFALSSFPLPSTFLPTIHPLEKNA